MEKNNKGTIQVREDLYEMIHHVQINTVYRNRVVKAAMLFHFIQI